jgi:restriction endonuclease Mrr
VSKIDRAVDVETAQHATQSPINLAEEELRKKRTQVRSRGASDLQKALAVFRAGQMVEAGKLYEKIISDYGSAGLELEPDVWSEVESFNRDVMKREAIRRQTIQRLDGRDFEIQVARLFSDMGYQVKVTTHNGGVDVWAFKEERKVVIQCKHWNKQVGPDVIRDLNGSQHRKEASEAIVVTSSTFSEEAVAEAREAGIRLIDGVELVRLYGEFYVASNQ